MAPSGSSVANNKARTSGREVPARPDERFWQRYSPHHEFPLSSVSSVMLHALILLLLGLAAFIAFKLGLSDRAKSPPVQVVEVSGYGAKRTVSIRFQTAGKKDFRLSHVKLEVLSQR